MRNPKNRLQDLEQNRKPTATQKLSASAAQSGSPTQKTQAMAFDHNEPIELRTSGQEGAIETRVFDHNEPIELRYNQETNGYVPSHPTYASAHSLTSDLDFGSGAFEVESFEAEPVATASPMPPTPEAVANQEPDRSQSMPLQPEVVADQSQPMPIKSAAPPVQADISIEPKPAASPEVATADDFLEDLQAILKGEKTYDGNGKQVVDASPQATQLSTPEPSTPASATPTPGDPAKQTSSHDVFDRLAQGLPPKPAPAASPTPTYSDAHSVFDRMGKNMTFANSFDLGTITLEQRFDEFDRMLDAEEKDSQLLSSTQFRKASNISKPQPDLQSDSLHYQQPNQISSAFVRPENILLEKREYKEHKVDLDPDNSKPYDYAFIGRGSSIAYYINALGNDLPENSIVIGEQDPWWPSDHEKSRGSGYINHQLQLIAQWGDQAPEYSLQYLDRLSFSKQNEDIINRVENQVISKIERIAEYKKGSKEPEVLFEITASKQYKAKKVIVGMGAGPQKNIDHLDTQRTITTKGLEDERKKERILDIDAFMRQIEDLRKKVNKDTKIIVHGANAGIDPVEAAASLGCEVTWLIRDTLPQLLEGQLLEYAPSIKPIRVEKVEIINGYKKLLHVTFIEKDKSKGTTIEVDYYVLALGQDINAPGAAGDVIDKDTILKKLEPIYDINQVYSNKPYETVLGLQTLDNTKAEGLEIIGAAAFYLGKNVKHNYIERTEKNLNDYMNRALSNEVYSGDIKMNFGDVASKYLKNLKKNIKSYLEPYLPEDKLSEHPFTSKTAPALNSQINESDEFTREEKQILKAVIAMLQDLVKAQIYFQFKKPDSNVEDEIVNQVKNEAANVIISPQLATVRASVGALVSVMPKYLQVQDEEIRRLLDNYKHINLAEKERIKEYLDSSRENLKVNFSGDSRTVLMVYATQKYPSISGEDAKYIVDQIIKHRNSNKGQKEGGMGGFHPLGYNRFWEEHWEEQFRWASDKEDKPNNDKENKINNDKKQEWEDRTKLMNKLEEEGREKWKSLNKGIREKSNEGLESLKKHLSSLDESEKSLLRNVYGDKRQEAWGYPPLPARPLVEIVLEGILTLEQGQKVYEILNSIK